MNSPEAGSGTNGAPADRTVMHSESNALPAGFAMHEYTIESVLGSGGFGVTYLAADGNLNLRVALKEYLPADIAVRAQENSVAPRSTTVTESYQWGLKRFLNEARALATFNHPHLVRVLRFFEANNTAYMVMEYIDGLPLRGWVDNNRPVTQEALTGIIAPLLDGLAEIHKAGFLHRDIKPGNIQIRQDGSPVLLDFGSARMLTGRADAELTAVVTPGYAPLEQYHSHGRQGAWTDIYSFAAVLYSIVVGKRPIEAAARTRNDPLAPAVDAADSNRYSWEFLRAIDWGLQPDETKRPQNVSEFRRALLPNEPDSRLSRSVGTHSVPAAATQRSSGPPSQYTSRPENFDAATLAPIERALAAHVGPVAAVMVRRAAGTSTSLESLCLELAGQIDDDGARAAFLKRTRQPHDGDARTGPSTRTGPSRSPAQDSRFNTGPSQAPGNRSGVTTGPSTSRPGGPATGPSGINASFTGDFLTQVETELARHIGPLAKVLVKRAAAKARDKAELYLLLADNISDAAERKNFVKKSLQAFRSRE